MNIKAGNMAFNAQFRTGSGCSSHMIILET